MTTDYHILTMDQLDELADTLYRIVPSSTEEHLRMVFASHTLLMERVKELETTVGWYEEKHPND